MSYHFMDHKYFYELRSNGISVNNVMKLFVFVFRDNVKHGNSAPSHFLVHLNALSSGNVNILSGF